MAYYTKDEVTDIVNEMLHPFLEDDATVGYMEDRLETILSRDRSYGQSTFESSFLDAYGDFVESRISPDSIKTFEDMLAVAGLGLAGEGGEVADIAKKVLYHGLVYDEIVAADLIKEIGDVLFYAAFAARCVLDTTLEEIITENVRKLTERYPSGFTVEDFLKKEHGTGVS